MLRVAACALVAMIVSVGASASDEQLALFSIDLSQDRQQVIARTQLVVEPEFDKGYFDYPTSPGSQQVWMLLLHYGEYKTTPEVLADMATRGLRPITFQELLWLHLAHPQMQRRFSIAALGSRATVRNMSRFPLLTYYRGELILNSAPLVLNTDDYFSWSPECRFGAIHIMHAPR